MAGRLKTPHLQVACAVCVVLALIAAGFAVWKFHRAAANERASEKSVAVLPFANLSTDPENGVFAEGGSRLSHEGTGRLGGSEGDQPTLGNARQNRSETESSRDCRCPRSCICR